MKIEELIERAKTGEAVVLILPFQAKGERVRLCGTYGPFGEILCVNHEGNTVARFSADRLLAFLEDVALAEAQ